MLRHQRHIDAVTALTAPAVMLGAGLLVGVLYSAAASSASALRGVCKRNNPQSETPHNPRGWKDDGFELLTCCSTDADSHVQTNERLSGSNAVPSIIYANSEGLTVCSHDYSSSHLAEPPRYPHLARDIDIGRLI